MDDIVKEVFTPETDDQHECRFSWDQELGYINYTIFHSGTRETYYLKSMSIYTITKKQWAVFVVFVLHTASNYDIDDLFDEFKEQVVDAQQPTKLQGVTK